MGEGMAAQVIANSIVLGLTLALMAIGLTLIYGILMVVNFAHGEFYMLGAVALFWVMDGAHLGYWFASVIAIVAVGILGWLSEVLIFRRFHGDLIGGCIAAIALLLGIQSITWELFGPRTRVVAAPVHGSFDIFGAVVSSERLLIAVVSLITILALAWFIKYAKLGKAMRAVSEDSEAARVQGIPAKKISALAFGIATGLAALAGVLVAPQAFVHPALGAVPLTFAFIVVIIGGMGSVMGSFIASMIIGFQQNLTTLWWGSQYSIAVAFMLAIIVLVLRPKGLMGHD
jgi:branched-chain amino acid transport system permease protein